jgi:hypothetical protein
MKKVVVLVACFLLSVASYAGTSSKCKKNYVKVSCSGIEKAKVNSFCWKGKLTEKKKIKICSAKKKIRKNKRMTKNKS